jgi:hypothetical protein
VLAGGPGSLASAFVNLQSVEFSPMSEAPLDKDLVAGILDNLKDHPSEILHEMVVRAEEDKWSPEALEAARLLLDQRSKGTAPEPVYETVPAAASAERAQSPPGCNTGDAVLAPSFGGRAYLYPGMIEEIKGQSGYIYFDNGDRRWVSLADVRPLELDVGEQLYSQLRGAGRIIGRQGDRFFVRYNDGGGEWVTLSQVVVPTERSPSFLERFEAVYGRFTDLLKRLLMGG